ncbi:MAG: RpiB/LacA/LacB family sugar-phosphate isomerase [Anaerolineae bacterium]|nr:RpiB/LacA/LacB family sugar-phosphate isomerase [Anaerolineae bacterium]
MKLAVGSDERTHLTDSVIDWLRKGGHDLILHGPLADQNIAWTAVGQAVAEDVAAHRADEGILFCWTGTGVSIAANKVPGIRAALCDDPETAAGARKWNNANVICLSLRRISEARAAEILEAWFNTAYQPNPQDDACIDHIAQIERKYSGEPLDQERSS